MSVGNATKKTHFDAVFDNTLWLEGILKGTNDLGANWLIQAGRELRLSDPDVAHGITNLVPTDVYGRLTITSGTAGGFQVVGLSDDDSAGLWTVGIIGTATPTATTPAIILYGAKKNGTTIQALANGETLLSIQNSGTEQIRVFGDGSMDIIAGGLAVGYSGTPVADKVSIVDSSFFVGTLGSGIVGMEFDTSDFIQYTRSTDTFKLGRAGANPFSVSAALAVLDATNISLLDETGSFGGGSGVISIGNALTNPTSNPTGGGILYVASGAGTWRGSGGTVTTFGPAGPHCGRCGYDFWRVSAENELWSASYRECGWCGAEYRKGPASVLHLLTTEQRNELVYK